MTTTTAYGVLPYTTLTDSAGIPLTGGSVSFLDNLTRDPKDVYQDAEGTTPYPNPIPLVNKGQVPPLYFDDSGDAYFVTAYDLNDNIIWTVSDFVPGGEGSSPTIAQNPLANLVINGQFRIFENQLISPLAKSTVIPVAPDNFFYFSNGNAGTDNISFQRFLPDNVDANSTPIYYVQYQCTAQGNSETIKKLYYVIKDVRSLASTVVTFSICAASLSGGSKPISLSILQNFGTGGSTPVPTPVGDTIILNSTFTTSQVSFTVPSMDGKNVGTAGDDYIAFEINLPLNQQSQIGITDFYVKQGTPSQDDFYPFQTYDQILAQVTGTTIPIPTQDQVYESSTFIPNSTYNSGGTFQMAANPPIGSVLEWPLDDNIPNGWFLCNGQAFPKTGFPARLFELLGFTYTSASTIDSFTAATNPSPVAVDITNNLVGASLSPPDEGTSPFTITVTTPGDGSTKEVVRVQTVAAPGIVAGQYFKISSVSKTFVFWAIKDGQGMQPATSGDYFVPFSIISADSSINVSSTLQTIANQVLYQVPDYRGVFLRGVSGGSGINVDPDAADRGARPDGTTGNHAGTTQDFATQTHSHTLPFDTGTGVVNSGPGAFHPSGGGLVSGSNSGNTSTETRPNNISINRIIKW